MGCDVAGSDISVRAVEDTNANLEWLRHGDSDLVDEARDENIFQADATTYDFSTRFSGREVVIVTEPYLGKPKKNKVLKSQIKQETEELKKLYLSFFRNIKQINKSGKLRVICFVFPLVETIDAGSISLYTECIDDLQNLGYNTLCTLGYGRDYQVVKREIVILTLQQPSNKKQVTN